MKRDALFRTFCVYKVITAAHAHKSGVIFQSFLRPFKQKKLRSYDLEKKIIAVWKMESALPHCHQKPMHKQTVSCQGQSVSTDAGGVKCLLMFIWRKLTCCSLIDCHSFFAVDDQALHVSCRGHRVMLTLTLKEGGRSTPWANGLDFWKISHTVENVEHRNRNLFEVWASSELKCCGA